MQNSSSNGNALGCPTYWIETLSAAMLHEKSAATRPVVEVIDSAEGQGATGTARRRRRRRRGRRGGRGRGPGDNANAPGALAASGEGPGATPPQGDSPAPSEHEPQSDFYDSDTDNAESGGDEGPEPSEQ